MRKTYAPRGFAADVVAMMVIASLLPVLVFLSFRQHSEIVRLADATTSSAKVLQDDINDKAAQGGVVAGAVEFDSTGRDRTKVGPLPDGFTVTAVAPMDSSAPPYVNWTVTRTGASSRVREFQCVIRVAVDAARAPDAVCETP